MAANIASLTGLRFFAAGAIVLHHSDKGVFFPKNWFAPFLLSSAVPLFFALSGFVLAVNADKYRSVADFFVARVARVWPAHLATIGLLVFAFYPFTLAIFWPPYLSSTLANVFLLQSWFPDPTFHASLNAPSWSVSCELFFYAMFPLLMLWMRTNPTAKALGLFAVAAVAMAALSRSPLDDKGVFSEWLACINPVVNLPTFALGIAAGMNYLRSPAPSSGTGLQLAALAAVAGVMWAAGTIPAGDHSAIGRFAATSAPAPAFAVLLVALAWPGPISAILSWRMFVYLGEISYSLYLTHQVIFRWFVDKRSLLSDYSPLTQYLAALAATLLISAAIYHIVERPFRRQIVAAWKLLKRPTKMSLDPAARCPD